MTIDEFSVSEECRHQLKRAGFTEVEQIVFFLEQMAIGQPMIRAGWIQYFDELIEALKELDLWSQTMERVWPSDE